MKSGFNNLNKIEKLDPVKNHLEIVQHTYQWVFSNETKISLQLAFPRTFAAHYIGKLLYSTTEFGKRPFYRTKRTNIRIYENRYEI